MSSSAAFATHKRSRGVQGNGMDDDDDDDDEDNNQVDGMDDGDYSDAGSGEEPEEGEEEGEEDGDEDEEDEGEEEEANSQINIVPVVDDQQEMQFGTGGSAPTPLGHAGMSANASDYPELFPLIETCSRRAWKTPGPTTDSSTNLPVQGFGHKTCLPKQSLVEVETENPIHESRRQLLLGTANKTIRPLNEDFIKNAPSTCADNNDPRLAFNDAWEVDPKQDKERFCKARLQIVNQIDKNSGAAQKEQQRLHQRTLADGDEGEEEDEEEVVHMQIDEDVSNASNTQHVHCVECHNMLCVNIPMWKLAPNATTLDEPRTDVSEINRSDASRAKAAASIKRVYTLLGLIECQMDGTAKLGSDVAKVEDDEDDDNGTIALSSNGDDANSSRGGQKKKSKKEGPRHYIFKHPSDPDRYVHMVHRCVEFLRGYPQTHNTASQVHQPDETEDQRLQKELDASATLRGQTALDHTLCPMRSFTGDREQGAMQIMAIRVWFIVLDPNYKIDRGVQMMMQSNHALKQSGAKKKYSTYTEQCAREITCNAELVHTILSISSNTDQHSVKNTSTIQKTNVPFELCNDEQLSSNPAAVTYRTSLVHPSNQTNNEPLKLGLAWPDGTPINIWSKQLQRTSYLMSTDALAKKTHCPYLFAPIDEIAGEQLQLLFMINPALNLLTTPLPQIMLSTRSFSLEVISAFVDNRRRDDVKGFGAVLDRDPTTCESIVAIRSFESLMKQQPTEWERNTHFNDFNQAMEYQLNGKSTVDDLKMIGNERNSSKNGRNKPLKTHSPRPQRVLYERLLQVYNELSAFCMHHRSMLDKLYNELAKRVKAWLAVEKDPSVLYAKTLLCGHAKTPQERAKAFDKAFEALEEMVKERWQQANCSLPVPDLANDDLSLDDGSPAKMWEAYWFYRHYVNKKRWLAQRKATMYDSYFKFAIAEVEEMMVAEVADLPAGVVTAYAAARKHLSECNGGSGTPVSETYQTVYQDLSTFGDMMQRETAFASEILQCPSARSWLMLYFTSFNAVADLDTKLGLLIMGAPGSGKSTAMKMCKKVLLPGRIEQQGETSDKANKNGNSETNCTIAFQDELPRWAKIGSEQLNDKKIEMTDGKNVHSRTVEQLDSSGVKRLTKETIITELQALIVVCANTGYMMGASGAEHVPNEFEALVDRMQFLYWRNIFTWEGAPPYIANMESPANKHTIELHRTRESLTILLILLRNSIPGFEVDFEHSNKMFAAMDEELKRMDVNPPTAREQEVRANLLRNMSAMHAVSNVFLNSAYKHLYPDLYPKYKTSTCGVQTLETPAPAFQMQHLRHCLGWFRSPTAEMGFHALTLQLMSSHKGDPLGDQVMSALCREVKFDTQALYTVRMATPGGQMSDFLKSAQSKEFHKTRFGKITREKTMATATATGKLPLEEKEFKDFRQFRGISAVPDVSQTQAPSSPNAHNKSPSNETDISPLEMAGLDDEALQKRLLCLETSLQGERLAKAEHTFGNADLKTFGMCLPSLTALNMYYSQQHVWTTITEQSRVPTHIEQDPTCSMSANMSRINYVRRTSEYEKREADANKNDEKSANKAAADPPNLNMKGTIDYCWIDASSLGNSMREMGRKLSEGPFLKSLNIPADIIVDVVRKKSEHNVTYRSPHKKKEGADLPKAVRELAQRYKPSDQLMTRFCTEPRKGAPFNGFQGSDDMICFDDRRIASTACSTDQIAVQLYDWLQQAADMALLRGGFKAASAQLGTGAVCNEPVMKLNFHKAADGAAAPTTSQNNKIQIYAIALARHAHWEVESRLLLARMGNLGCDPQMHRAYSSNAGYSPTEDLEHAGSLPLMWEGIIVAKLIKAAMRRLWHRSLDVDGDEKTMLQTAPSLSNRINANKFTIPIGETGKPRLLCIDPSKMQSDEQALRDQEDALRRQLELSSNLGSATACETSGGGGGGAGTSSDPIALDVSKSPTLFPSGILQQSNVTLSQVQRLGLETSKPDQTGQAAAPPRDCPPASKKQKTTSSDNDTFMTQLALNGKASMAKNAIVNKERSTTSRPYSNYESDPWLPYTVKSLQSLGLTANKFMSTVISELSTSKLSKARFMELSASKNELDYDESMDDMEGVDHL